MRGIVGGVFYVLGGMMLLSTLLNACSSNANSGQGAVSAAILAVILLGIAHLIYPVIGGRGGQPQVDPAEYARIQRDRAVEQARLQREQQMGSAQEQLAQMKKDIIAQAEKRNRELGGGR